MKSAIKNLIGNRNAGRSNKPPKVPRKAPVVNPYGPDRVEINLDELEKICELQCTDDEVASFFRVGKRTIEYRKTEPEFAEAMERGKARGRISVRRIQMRLLEEGNATMGVWLGKQILGQRDYDRERIIAESAAKVVIPDFVVSVTAATDHEIRLSGNETNRTSISSLPVQ